MPEITPFVGLIIVFSFCFHFIKIKWYLSLKYDRLELTLH